MEFCGYCGVCGWVSYGDILVFGGVIDIFWMFEVEEFIGRLLGILRS